MSLVLCDLCRNLWTTSRPVVLSPAKKRRRAPNCDARPSQPWPPSQSWPTSFGAPSQCDRDPQRGDQIVLEIVSPTEIPVIEVVLEIDPDGAVPAFPETEAETRADRPADIRPASI